MQIQSTRLVVDIDEPGSSYRGTRFDWSGFITQVTLDGQHTFCVPEPNIPGAGSGGAGLCNEFGSSSPVGYTDAKPGDCFPKIGIGLLTRREDQTYSFRNPYDLAPFTIRVDAKPDAVTYTIDPVECRGYALAYSKRISIVDANLLIDYRLENVGQKPVQTEEYNHNFVAIDRHTIGRDYRLTIAYDTEYTRKPDILHIDGTKITLTRMPATREESFYCRTIPLKETGNGWWELVHTPSGVGMREQDSFPWSVFALWGTPEVISPEAFVAIDLQPGAVKTWQRAYTFFKRDE